MCEWAGEAGKSFWGAFIRKEEPWVGFFLGIMRIEVLGTSALLYSTISFVVIVFHEMISLR